MNLKRKNLGEMMLMKGKNYNLELIRMISFILVIAIHVANYFCRAYGDISQGEYLFSLVLDTAARISVPCFFMISGAHIRFGERARKVIDLFCGCSFGIYLNHILFLDNYKKYIEPADLSAWIAVPGLIAGITLASFICVWAFRRFKLGRSIT